MVRFTWLALAMLACGSARELDVVRAGDKKAVPPERPEENQKTDITTDFKKADAIAKKLQEAAKAKADAEKAERAEAARLAAEANVKKLAAAAKTLDDVPRDAEGYALLLGKDLALWYYGEAKAILEGKTESPDKVYQLANDTLVVETVDKKQARTLRNVKQLGKRYELKCDFRTDKTGVATLGLGNNFDVKLRDLSKSSQKPLKTFKPGDWNSLEIAIHPGTYSATVDQKKLSDADILEIALKNGRPTIAVNGRPIEPNSLHLTRSQPIVTVKVNGEDLQKGHFQTSGNGLNSQISVRSDTGKVEIRNLRLKVID